ncbi:MAG: hypothetical protein IID63_06795 [candidate division Zixibacteria bacterium]|nr:hypothetical protein [candidate division Zixibacteria bacterium]
MQNSLKERKAKITLNIFYLSLLSQSVAFAVAMLPPIMENLGGKENINAFMILSIVHSIGIGIIGFYQRRFLHIQRFWVRVIILLFAGIMYAFIWTYAIEFLLLIPVFEAFSYSILHAWIISGTLTLVISTLRPRTVDLIEQPDKQVLKYVRRKRNLTFAGILFLLPAGFAIVFLIIGYLVLIYEVLFSWKYIEGAMTTSGSTYCILYNNNSWVTSIVGHKRISVGELREISIYHTVIVCPDGEILSAKDSYFSDGPVTIKGFERLIRFDSKTERRHSLSVELNLLDSTLKSGDSIFHLASGNFFLITLDSMFGTSITQFPIVNYEVLDCATIIEQFNKVLEGHIAEHPLVLRYYWKL